MTLEDFTTYTEVDPTGAGAESGHIQFTANHIDGTVSRNEDAYLYKDYLLNHFNNFTHIFDARVATGAADFSVVAVYGISDTINDRTGWNNGISVQMHYNFPNDTIYLVEMDSGSLISFDGFNDFILNTWYFFKLVKNGTSVVLGIYSTAELRDAGDGTDGNVDNLTLTLTADRSYQYIYGICSTNDDADVLTNCDINNLDLAEAPPAVLAMAASITTITKALGIISLTVPKFKQLFPNFKARIVI